MCAINSSGSNRPLSVARLLRLLMALGRDVDIVIRKPKRQRPGRLSIEAAQPAQSFGRFRNKLTLHAVVCDGCSQYFERQPGTRPGAGYVCPDAKSSSRRPSVVVMNDLCALAMISGWKKSP